MLLILTTAIALSVDGFAAGAAFGLRGVRIGPSALTIIALLSAGFAACAVTAGGVLAALLPPKAGLWLGAGLLMLLGCVSVVRALRPKRAPHPPKPPKKHRFHVLGLTILVIREPAEGDLDHSGAIDPGEALLLGLSLSVDMLGAGIGLALTSAGGFWLLPPTVGLVQTGCLALGGAAGRQLTKLPFGEQVFGVCAGLLLFLLGAARLLL